MKNFINKALVLVFATVALTSCLKDDSMVLDPEKAGANLVDFVNPAEIAVHGSTTPLYVLSYPIVTTPTPVKISVAYSGAEDAAPNDITVNIGLAAQSVIDQYNTEQNKAYEMMPSAWYTLSATSVVIPKGQKTASFTVNVNTSLIDLSKAFVLPLKLTSPNAAVSANFGTALLAIGAKNPYDGLYNYKTSANTVLAPNLNKNNVQLVTTSATTVALKPGLVTLYSNVVTYTIDPVTNGVTVTAALGAGAETPPDPRSKWDPVKKVLTVYWRQSGGSRTFEEVFTYQGPR